MSGMFAGIVALLYILKQMLTDIASMLVGNVTNVLIDTSALLGTVQTLMGSLAGMLWDIERILEKVVDLLIS